MSTPKLLSIPQVAEALGDVSRKTVYRLLYAGELDRVDIGTGSRPRPRVPEASLADYIARHLVPGRKTATTRKAAA